MSSFLHLKVHGVATGKRVHSAVRWWQRAIGLLATRELQDPCGMWIAPCNAVHTFGMRYAIDLIYLTRDGVAIKIVHRLAPWRMSSCRHAFSTLELRAGLAAELQLSPGVKLQLHD